MFVVATGCDDFLEKYPLDTVNTENFYKTASDAEAAIAAAYDPISDMYGGPAAWIRSAASWSIALRPTSRAKAPRSAATIGVGSSVATAQLPRTRRSDVGDSVRGGIPRSFIEPAVKRIAADFGLVDNETFPLRRDHLDRCWSGRCIAVLVQRNCLGGIASEGPERRQNGDRASKRRHFSS